MKRRREYYAQIPKEGMTIKYHICIFLYFTRHFFYIVLFLNTMFGMYTNNKLEKLKGNLEINF